jgi:large subunit ribosomal protein L10
MDKSEKEAAVKALTQKFKDSDAVVLTEYRGLSVAQVTELRQKLGQDASYTVAKNTLARIAAKEAGVEGLDPEIKGPSALVFISGDYVAGAKTLRDFATKNKQLIVKGGYVDGSVLKADDVKRLADMQTREGALSEFAGDIKSAIASAIRIAMQVPTKAVRTVDALAKKQEKAA